MDKPVDDLTAARRRPRVRFGPDRRLTALAGAGMLAVIGLAVTTADASGRLLFVLAAVVLAAYVVTDLVFWPRLAVDTSGLQVRAPCARARRDWAHVDEVRADVRTRYGLRSVTLEIDAGETLIVLSRRALGADPDSVADVVRAFDPRRRP